jgi:adenylate cyclase
VWERAEPVALHHPHDYLTNTLALWIPRLPLPDTAVSKIASWVVERGLAGGSEVELLEGFCVRCRDAGITLSHAMIIIDTLHPVYEGRAFKWRAKQSNESPVFEYGPTGEGEAAARWQQSPFHYLLQNGESELRRRAGRDPADFPMIEQFRADGHTDSFVMLHRFDREGSVGEMDAVYSHWASDQADGFGDDHLDALRTLVPTLALATKCISLVRVAGTIAEVYLGRDPGQRVLAGNISRGVADWLHAVLWFSDLREFTELSERVTPGEIISFLNDYADVVISAIHDAGGDVLKLTGDGILAIFAAQDSTRACEAALKAERAMRAKIAELVEQRTAAGKAATSVYLGLHVGDVFYGNIGSQDRLDFTVIGPAVNEVCRVAEMCRSARQPTLMTDEFRMAAPAPERSRLVSVGRYALRGVDRVQELFTLDQAGHAGTRASRH